MIGALVALAGLFYVSAGATTVRTPSSTWKARKFPAAGNGSPTPEIAASYSIA